MSEGRLFVVATPIGNLSDLSPRAKETLVSADLILCEDTRHSGKLLAQIGARARKLSYHEHNERERTEQVLAELAQGKRVALISDAGTPTISDPGFRLVRACREAAVPVHPIPGPAAVIAALSGAGLPTDQFVFVGFPPKTSGKRRRFFEQAAHYPMTAVFYLSPHQAARDLYEMAEIFGAREAVLAREMTKLFEEFIGGALAELAARLNEDKPKGELVLVVAGAPQEAEAEDVEDVLADLRSEGLSGRSLAEGLALRCGLSKKDAYKLALEAEREE
jgi:16S rRNA (cytidine1402-2'-O)-methyltransferase